MIAYVEGNAVERPRIGGSRAGRTAAKTRRARTARLRRRALGILLTILVPSTLAIVGYLGLMANVTRLNYELAKQETRHGALLERTGQLDDRIAQLASRDRLAHMAQVLGLRPAETLTVATLPPPKPVERPRGLAFLPIAAGWLR